MTNKERFGFSSIILLTGVVLILAIFGTGYFLFKSKDSPEVVTETESASETTDEALRFESGIRLQPKDFGVTAGLPVADVSAVKLPDGMWRIYAFAQNKGIVSALSADGLVFTPEDGSRMGDGAGMPRIIKLDDGSYRLYFIEMGGVGSAVSSDGLTFVREKGLRITQPEGVKDISGISSPVKLADGKWHVYFSDLPRPGEMVKPHYIYSATSNDLVTWALDSGYRIGGTIASTSGEHPDAVLNSEGTLVLYYFVNGTKKLVYSTSRDGLTFTDAVETGLDCNDPNIVPLGDGTYRIYCGDFVQTIGGIVKSALVKNLPK